ncbi:MAG: UvrD-helicase domain-containing protein [Bulleidia sp.]|nr:UvrD-helicase domain-containing protein [Bulleidia sp.]
MIDTSLLNEQQKQAVLDDSQYLRIVAGAGSGKTRVLTMRIVHLIQDEGVWPSRILAITFTNKAANEMKQRISAMLGAGEHTGIPWISTIHSLCVRILREDIGNMGYPKDFTIVDADDQKSILREGYKQLELDTQSLPHAAALNYISSCKQAGMTPKRALELAGNFGMDQEKAKVYAFYMERLASLKALDFDDLILWTVRLLDGFADVEEKWQKRFRYIHVDEFQDIDRMQYKLIRHLAGENNNLYVVGDPDQTIYTWRGADVNIIMNFVHDFHGSKTIMLNQNYRSTSNILEAANCVIRNNQNRLKKDLFSTGEAGARVTHFAAGDDLFEASWVAGKIQDLHRKGKNYHDIAILYRSNYLSRSLEKAMLDERIPYIIYGGIRFYERQEVKDALSYLRMCAGADDLAFMRVINRPKRGIGNKTIDTISQKAAQNGISMYEEVKSEKLFSARTQNTIDSFVDMIEEWREKANDGYTGIDQLLTSIIEESGLRKSYEEAEEPERIENMKELVDDAANFMKEYPDSSLDEYLQMVSLYGDRDEGGQADCVQLMTVHAAKGLEFDTVFVTDMNDGIFPNERALNETGRGLEEERRLAYVAFTRAKKKLYITEAAGYSFILQRQRTRSRFINEIDARYIEHAGLGYEKRREPAPGRMQSSSAPSFSFSLKENSMQAQAGLKTGDRVSHAKFGEGLVINCKGGIAEIAFPYPYGVKKIAAGHPSLKKVAN